MPLRIRPQRIYQRRDSVMRALADQAAPGIRRYLRQSLAHLKDDFDAKEALRLARSGRWNEIAREAIDWGHFREILRAPFARMAECHEAGALIGVARINRAFTVAGRRVRFKKKAPGQGDQVKGGMSSSRDNEDLVDAVSELIKSENHAGLDFDKALADQFNFDRFDPATQAMLRDEQDRLIRELEAGARDTINQVGQDALRAGLGPEATVGQIREVIGLTARQAQAVVNYRNMLESLDATVLSRALRDPQYDDAISAAIESGDSFSAAAVDEMVGAYESRYLDYRAKTIADTESVRMANQGLQDAYRQSIARGAVPAEAVRQYWLVDPDEAKTCDVCLSIPDRNPQGVAIGEDFDSLEGPVDAPPQHPNCFIGETIVSAVGVRAATVRWFEGDLCVVRTARGNKFSCTANHPILTAAGWVAAGLLVKGDNVIKRATGKREVGIDVDDQNIPSSIQDIAESFGRSLHVVATEVPVAAPDFHGDGVGSEVAIVWTNGQLRNRFETFGDQAVENRSLAVGHSPGSLHGLSPRDLFGLWHMSATRCVVRGLHLLGSFVVGHLGPLQRLGFRLAPNYRAAFSQPSPDGAAINAEYLGNFQFGRAILVAENCIRRCMDFLFRSPQRLQSESGKRPLDPRVAYAKLAGDIVDGRFCPVERDTVVDVALRKFSGHVYNLETRDGFYVANGVIAHNCRCEISIETDLSLIPDEETKQ